MRGVPEGTEEESKMGEEEGELEGEEEREEDFREVEMVMAGVFEEEGVFEGEVGGGELGRLGGGEVGRLGGGEEVRRDLFKFLLRGFSSFCGNTCERSL